MTQSANDKGITKKEQSVTTFIRSKTPGEGGQQRSMAFFNARRSRQVNDSSVVTLERHQQQLVSHNNSYLGPVGATQSDTAVFSSSGATATATETQALPTTSSPPDTMVMMPLRTSVPIRARVNSHCRLKQ